MNTLSSLAGAGASSLEHIFREFDRQSFEVTITRRDYHSLKQWTVELARTETGGQDSDEFEFAAGLRFKCEAHSATEAIRQAYARVLRLMSGGLQSGLVALTEPSPSPAEALGRKRSIRPRLYPEHGRKELQDEGEATAQADAGQ